MKTSTGAQAPEFSGGNMTINRWGERFELSGPLKAEYEIWDGKEACWLWLTDEHGAAPNLTARCIYAQRELDIEPGDDDLPEMNFRKKYEGQGRAELEDAVIDEALKYCVDVWMIDFSE